MKILLANKIYYNRGGDCTATISLEKLLQEYGHQTAIFSTQHPLTEPSEWSKYFPSNIALNLKGLPKAVMRIFHSPEVITKFISLLEDFKPDILHVHNIHSYLSPVICQIAKDRGIKVVWTLHDYKLICPAYTCLNNNDICERCFTNKGNVFIHKCMKNSYPASFIGWMEALYWNQNKLLNITDIFISPSNFLKSKMVQAGFPEKKIEVLHNFMGDKMPHSFFKEDYYCYAGRLSKEKGVDILLEAALSLPYKLKIIGGGSLLDTYKKKYNLPNIEFLNQQPREKVLDLVNKSKCLVVPSKWYENNPFNIIEALCMGTPVVGSLIGGIPELIENTQNGFLCTPNSVSELQSNITNCMDSFTKEEQYKNIATNACNLFSKEKFYSKLIQIYEQ